MALRKLSLNANDGRKALAFDSMGIGLSTVTTLTSFDWQQADLLSAGIYRVAVENMSNTPTGVSFTNGTGVFIIVDGTSAGGQRYSVEVIPDTSTDSNYKIFKVLVVGVKGSRTFSVRQIWNSSDIIPVSSGGTGSGTAIAAAYNIGALPVRGALPANANLNNYGPTSTHMGIWFQGTSGNAQIATNFPEANAVGFLEVFAGGQWGCTQRYTVRTGSMYVRSLTATWNGTDGPWGAWNLVGVNSQAGFFTGDLNTLVTPGVWSITDGASGTTNGPVAPGAPTISTGICEVFLRNSSTQVVQRFTTVATGAANINRTWQRTLSGTTWSSWEQLGAKALYDIGLNLTTLTPISALDWNQFDFTSGQEFSVAASNMSNTPPGIDITGWGSTPVCFNVIGIDNSIVTVELWLSHVNDSVFRRYQVRISGAKGSRIYAVRQIWTSADIIPVANGGTGANTAATGLQNLLDGKSLPLAADAAAPNDAVTLRQLQAASGGGGGANMSGVMNNFIGAVEWFQGTRAALPAGCIAADGQTLVKTENPDLWNAVNTNFLLSTTEAIWQSTPTQRGKYAHDTSATTFRVPDLNGKTSGTPQGAFLRGDGGSTGINFPVGEIHHSAAPDITGTVGAMIWGVFGGSTGVFRANGPVASPPALSTTTTPAACVRFQASLSDSAGASRYGWESPVEVRPTAATGIWIIRANGNFQAANTSWQVINADATQPSVGSVTQGGSIKSIYKVGQADFASVSISSKVAIGQKPAVNITLVDNNGKSYPYQIGGTRYSGGPIPLDGLHYTWTEAAAAGFIFWNPAITNNATDSTTVSVYPDRIEIRGILRPPSGQSWSMVNGIQEIYSIPNPLPGKTKMRKAFSPAIAGTTNTGGAFTRSQTALNQWITFEIPSPGQTIVASYLIINDTVYFDD